MYNFVDHRPIPGAKYLSGDEIETRRSTYPFDKYIAISDTNLEELKELFASNPSNEYAIVMDKSLSLNKELMEFLAKNSSKNVFYIRENNSSSETTLYDEKETQIFIDNVNLIRKKYQKDIKFEDGSTAEQALDASRRINKLVEHINKVKEDGTSLSPLEKYICAYQFVANFVYKEENTESENHFKSRNLVSILTGDKIVCVGHAAMLKEICTRIGIQSEIQYWHFSDDNIGHANNLVRIDDDKYNIHTIYYADACWDSKRVTDKKQDIPNTLIYSFMDFADILKIHPTLVNDGKNIRLYEGLLSVDLDNKYKKCQEEYAEKYDGEDKLQKSVQSEMDERKPQYLAKIDNLLKDYPIEKDKSHDKELSAYHKLMLELFIILPLMENEDEQKIKNDLLWFIRQEANLSKEILKEYLIEILDKSLVTQVEKEMRGKSRKLSDRIKNLRKEITEIETKSKNLASDYYSNKENRPQSTPIPTSNIKIAWKNIANFFEDDSYIKGLFGGDIQKQFNDSLLATYMQIKRMNIYHVEGLKNTLIKKILEKLDQNNNKEEDRSQS